MRICRLNPIINIGYEQCSCLAAHSRCNNYSSLYIVLLNSEQGPEECDATKAEAVTMPGTKKKTS